MPPEEPTSSWRSAATASCSRPCTRCIDRPVPIYGMNLGTVGFLLNAYRPSTASSSGSAARQRRAALTRCACAPASPTAAGRDGLGINEVSLFRETRQAARLAIAIDGVVPPARAGLRRRAGRHAGRQHRLQPLRARADPPGRRQPAGADPDQRVPPAALARRPAAERAPASASGARSRQAAGQRRRRLHRGPRRRRGRDLGGPRASRSTCCSTPSTISRSGS